MKKSIHFNRPQLRSILVAAPSEIFIAGRGTGKTEGVLAYKTAVCYRDTMPRSTGVILGTTYTQLLTRTLPALMAGWERIGYQKGVHYIVGKEPPDKWKKHWNWKGPYRQPLLFKNFISWWNGSGFHLVSQDVKGSGNGITIDDISGDEAKFLNGEKFQTELLPANRGIVPAYAGNVYHHGITLTTDMPTGTSGRWLFDMAAACDHAAVKQILKLQAVKSQVRASNEFSARQKETLCREIEEEIKPLRKNLLYYHEASTIDNIHALGLDYIKDQMRRSTQLQFDTQILNIKNSLAENGFYPDFRENEHGYYSYTNKDISQLEFDFSRVKEINCSNDSDLDSKAPLHIAIDYNRRIHPIVVGQVINNEIRTLKGIHTLYPEMLKPAVQKFCDYYSTHKTKMVYYWYDQTAVGKMDESTKADDVILILRKNGWKVIEMYTGKNPLHDDKYYMWGHLLQESGKYGYKFLINRENCKDLITSIHLAGTIQGKNGFEKDKRPERDEKFPAQEATHYSDALDMWVYGILESELSNKFIRISGTSIVTT